LNLTPYLQTPHCITLTCVEIIGMWPEEEKNINYKGSMKTNYNKRKENW
jgi:hypothetical protein